MLSWLRIFDFFKVPQAEAQAKSGLSRRSFLKVLGVSSVAVAVPKLWVPETKVVAAEPQWLISASATNIDGRDEARRLNEALFAQLLRRDPVAEKMAIDAVNDFTRMKLREDGFYRRILPPMPISDDQLAAAGWARHEPDPEPEPEPAAFSIPFATLPTNTYIRGPRYRVTFDRIVTPKFVQDVDETRVWKDQATCLDAARARTNKAANDDERRIAWSFWNWFKRKPAPQEC